MKKYVFITTSVPAFHSWEEAPEEVKFLSDLHRHIFHIKLVWEVCEDRELEFFIMKRKVDAYLEQYKEKDIGMSCEMFAERLLTEFGCVEAEVSEDKENGAIARCWLH